MELFLSLNGFFALVLILFVSLQLATVTFMLKRVCSTWSCLSSLVAEQEAYASGADITPQEEIVITAVRDSSETRPRTSPTDKFVDVSSVLR